MKTLTAKLLLTVFSLCLATGMAFGQSGPAKVFIEVKGLACPFCVQGLEKQLNKLDAVEGVRTSLKKGEAVLDLKPGQTVAETEVRQAVKKAGFTAGQIRFDEQSAAAKPAKPVDGEKK